jgi:tetratricopeptide (TPR) repeat protein
MRRALLLLAAIAIAPSFAHAECVTENRETAALVSRADAITRTNIDESIALYEEAFRAASTSSRIASRLAAAYERKEEWAKAITVLEKACALEPTDARFAFRLGHVRARAAAVGASSFVDAMNALSMAVKLDPNWGEAHFELADVLWRLQDEQHALEHFTKAVQLRPSVAAHWVALADFYRRLQLVPQAARVIAQAPRYIHADDPERFGVHELAGRLHVRAGENDAAIASYEEAKRACGACNERGQMLIFFELGIAYASAKPPHVDDARTNLGAFQRAICKGGAAARYVDECVQTASVLSNLP